MSHNILIVGCGSIGLRLAMSLKAQHQVYGLKRNAEGLPAEINGISADVTLPSTLRGRLPNQLDYVVYCLTASEFNDETYQEIYVKGLTNLINELALSNLSPKRLFFVSSSSVYSQDNDQWVNEETPVSPTRFSGQRLLEAEAVALSCKFPASNIRFSGIYGGSRTRLLKQVKSGAANSNSPAYTNRVHEDDCVLILKHLIKKDSKGGTLEDCYLASDSEPVPMSKLVAWIADQVKCSASSKEKSKAINAKKRSAGSKRCSNKRLLDSGYQFKYPSFKEGYEDMIKEIKGPLT